MRTYWGSLKRQGRDEAGSRWSLLVGVSSNRQRVLIHVIRSPDGNNWTLEELQMIYLETVNKRNAKQDAE